MPALNLDIDYFNHPKTKRLMRLLGRGSEVVPLRMWCYTARYFAADGRLTGISAEELESECQWWGEKGAAVKAMEECGFLDRELDCYAVHDWKDHEGHIQAFKHRAKAGANARWYALGSATSDASSTPTSLASTNAPTNCTNQLYQLTNHLATARMAEVWKEWQLFRRKMKKCVDFDALFSRQALWLSKFDEPTAHEILCQSMRNGWQGLFEPKSSPKPQRPSNPHIL